MQLSLPGWLAGWRARFLWHRTVDDGCGFTWTDPECRQPYTVRHYGRVLLSIKLPSPCVCVCIERCCLHYIYWLCVINNLWVVPYGPYWFCVCMMQARLSPILYETINCTESVVNRKANLHPSIQATHS